jgi:hypothetical protein
VGFPTPDEGRAAIAAARCFKLVVNSRPPWGPCVVWATRGRRLQRAASYADRIQKGVKVAKLPIQQPTKYELTTNLKIAKALGLTVSPGLLAVADEVIE